MTQATTIGALRETGYRPKSVKEELRANLISALAAKREMFKGIVGYETTVIPQIENAILSGQDIIFLGERGQAKTRLARRLIELLDASVPAIAGCEINDDPFAPICAACKYRVANDGESVAVGLLGWWSWRESNPRPPSGNRPCYDHSRVCGSTATAPPGRWSSRSPPGLSPMPAVFPAASSLCCRHPLLLLPGCSGLAPRALTGRDDSQLPK